MEVQVGAAIMKINTRHLPQVIFSMGNYNLLSSNQQTVHADTRIFIRVKLLAPGYSSAMEAGYDYVPPNPKAPSAPLVPFMDHSSSARAGEDHTIISHDHITFRPGLGASQDQDTGIANKL